ncbi:Protein of unknown function [Geodermatophilus siccatus]|uniref:DUF4244 domain-containing protein n=1 Tax=Geodermatophilus siccatus TaxID=1137991 RepID=A0A1G9TRI1_9ACTN|nr:DUF4244 domain-containing protein [Geodermatophilus siccatus]SDM50178.1 Protein of unknown function [Geodermatophilus siccatus]
MTTPCETRPDEELPDAGGTPVHEAAPRGLRARWARVQAAAEAGMSTAEYAVGTVAACAFAAVLYRVVTGGSVVEGLSALVADALATLS